MAHQKAKFHLLSYIGITKATPDPLEGILKEVATSEGLVQAYTEMLGGMNNDDPFWFATVQCFNEERDRHVKFSKIAIDADVLERQTRVAEGTGGALIALVTSVLLDHSMHLSPQQVENGRRLLAE